MINNIQILKKIPHSLSAYQILSNVMPAVKAASAPVTGFGLDRGGMTFDLFLIAE